ncbi:TlpA disulfide reductase family protein [Butyricimonas hominis]|nr:TlpA disulfide reductase family protein [Butyricimonas hominis]
MMKKIGLSILLTVCAYVTSVAQEGFKITGHLGGTLGGDLVLATTGAEGLVKLDEAVMINGEFEFAGRVDGVIHAYILTAEQQPVATLMLENLEYTVVAGEKGIEVQGGGESQKILNQYNEIQQIIAREKMRMEQETRAAYSQQNQMKLQALQQQFQKVMEEMKVKQAELFRVYKDSPVTAFMLVSSMGEMDYSSLKNVYDKLGEPAKNSLYGQAIVQQLALFKQVELGSVAPDFTGTMSGGESVSLHGIKAKLKLVDFWASWCAPCRQEMPNVVKIYKKYREAGLEIIGVSLDTKVPDWLKAMQDEKMTWPNIMDEQKGISARYLVRGIPHTVLLDENNRIVAKNLRGKTLEKKIAELLGK